MEYSDGIQFTSWDLGGADKIDPLKRHYYPDMKGIVFVVDSNDYDKHRVVTSYGSHDRMEEAGYELRRLLREELLCGAPVLIFANKQDLPNALSTTDITEKMELNTITDRPWYIQGCCATAGDGLYEGVDWLKDILKNNNTARDDFVNNVIEGVREKQMEKQREINKIKREEGREREREKREGPVEDKTHIKPAKH